MAAVLLLPLVAASSRAPTPDERPSRLAHAGPAGARFAALTPADVAAAVGDLRDFRLAARRPPASAPLRRLPTVNLAAVNVGEIPRMAAVAYVTAARRLARTDPSCGVRWWLLAGIGFVESGHAAFGGSHRPGWNGVARPPILGPVLDGSGHFAAIRDTDNGRYDGNTRWDRAVGPMQFLPSTWERWGAPRPGAPAGNPENMRAAAVAAARYLCASGGDLTQPHDMAVAVYSYNHSFDYVRLVLSVAARYAGMDPAAFGVNSLPTDKQVRGSHHHRKRAHRRTSPSTTASGSQTAATASPSPTTAAATTTSPSPAPTTTSAPAPLPTASPTITPLPTGPGLP